MTYTVQKIPLSAPDWNTHTTAIKVLVTIALMLLPVSGFDVRASRPDSPGADTMEIVLPIEFPINSYRVDPAFSGNGRSLDSLETVIRRCASDTTFSMGDIVVAGSASPDGRFTSNMRLARRRMLALRDYIASSFSPIPDGVKVLPGDYSVCWPDFRRLVAESGMPDAAEVLAMCSEGSDTSAGVTASRVRALRRHAGGATWKRLAADIFPKLRNAVSFTVHVRTNPQEAPLESAPVDTLTVVAPVRDVLFPEPETAVTSEISEDACPRGWHLETNLLEWSLAIANIAGEFDFGRRWSAALSLHYSAWDYGKSTRKFRTFIFRPEVRRWLLNDCHTGLFVDAHLQMAAYNFALPGWEYRVQDAGGTHPALGGGIGVGYRLPLGRKGRWALQAQVGAGVYRLDYNRFENRPDGAQVDRRRRTFFGLDNAAVSVVFNFNGLKK